MGIPPATSPSAPAVDPRWLRRVRITVLASVVMICLPALFFLLMGYGVVTLVILLCCLPFLGFYLVILWRLRRQPQRSVARAMSLGSAVFVLLAPWAPLAILPLVNDPRAIDPKLLLPLGWFVLILLTQAALWRSAKKAYKALWPEESARRKHVLGTVIAGGYVVSVLFLEAVALPGLLPARITSNETSAVGALRTINTAAIQYDSTYRKGFPAKLADLGPPPAGSEPTTTADLIDSVLAAGTKSGYNFTYAAVDTDRNGTMDAYTLNADPVTPGTTGQRHFFTDQSGVIRQNTSGRASGADPPIS